MLTLAQFIVFVITVFFAVFLGIGFVFLVMVIAEDYECFREYKKSKERNKNGN